MTSDSLFDTFEPRITQGLLDYAKSLDQGPNPWNVAGKALSSFSKNYMQALQDPRTRGMAIGAGASGVGDVLTSEFGPEAKLKGTMAQASVLDQLAKYRDLTGRGGKNSSEYERLLAMAQSPGFDPNSDEGKHVMLRLGTFETEGKPKTYEYTDLLKERDTDRYKNDPKYAADVEKHIAFLNTHGGGSSTTNNIGIGGGHWDPATNQWMVDSSKETNNAISKDLNEAESFLQNTNNALNKYNPEAYQYKPQVEQWGRAVKEKLGYKLTTEQQAATKAIQDSDSAIEYASSILRNQVFGAAVTGGEQQNAQHFIPGKDDSPSEVKSKLDTLNGIATAAVQRLRIARTRGFSVSDMNNPEVLAAKLGPLENYMPGAKGTQPASDVSAPLAPVAVGGGTGGPAPAGAGPPPSGLLGPAASAAPAAPPGGGLLPPGPVTSPSPTSAAQPVPAVAPPQAGPPPAGPQLSVQGGRLAAPPITKGDRAAANAVAAQALKQGVPPQLIDQWLKENGI